MCWILSLLVRTSVTLVACASQAQLSGVPSPLLNNLRHVSIYINFPYNSASPEHEMYLLAIQIVLRIVPNLRDLVLLWDGVPARIFDGVTFSLEALTCTMRIDDTTVQFLHSQPNLQLVELPRWTDADVIPPRSLLPSLGELSCPPEAVVHLAPGRPIRSLDLRVTRPRTDIDWTEIFQSLALTTDIIDDLSIATLDDFSSSILRCIAQNLPSLRSLYIRVAAWDTIVRTTQVLFEHLADCVPQDVFKWTKWAKYLAHLPFIEEIKVEIDCQNLHPDHPGSFAVPSLSSVMSWSETCTYLTNVYVGLYLGDALISWERDC